MYIVTWTQSGVVQAVCFRSEITLYTQATKQKNHVELREVSTIIDAMLPLSNWQPYGLSAYFREVPCVHLTIVALLTVYGQQIYSF